MTRRHISAALTLCAQAALAQANKPFAEREFAMVRPLYSGARALETVAYMDRFVRWPGNPGFDSSIMHVAARLAAAGFIEQSKAGPADRLTYRIEKFPMAGAAWEPQAATLEFASPAGAAPILSFATNRNMVATNSYSTPAEGIEAEVVRVAAMTPAALDSVNVKGKIVMADAGVGRLFSEAVVRRGAIGVLAYSMPAYTQPVKNTHSIQFSGIADDTARKGWGVLLSFDARRQLLDAMRAGPVRVRVKITTGFTRPATELAIVAEVKGSAAPGERFVYSAHIQEPGANDDASGVATLTEMARTLAELVKKGQANPRRTITMLWGQEIRVTDRYLKQDTLHHQGARWGISLDMTGEDTKKTGGVFLIEKLPDPSAIWTRGNDKHTEWGGPVLDEGGMKPHYFNDFLISRTRQQGKAAGWTVSANPFEGGSDHIAFLNNDVPGVLFWHFTDQFYHTDGDRLDKVSPDEMKNVGVSALVSGLILASGDASTAAAIIAETEQAAIQRLDTEAALSKAAIGAGGDVAKERHILETWGAWYDAALRKATDIEIGGPGAATTSAIDAATKSVKERLSSLTRSLAP
ncbi:MAG TPA: M28 family peptidase [Gemmatimonadaceae bacterium]